MSTADNGSSSTADEALTSLNMSTVVFSASTGVRDGSSTTLDEAPTASTATEGTGLRAAGEVPTSSTIPATPQGPRTRSRVKREAEEAFVDGPDEQILEPITPRKKARVKTKKEPSEEPVDEPPTPSQPRAPRQSARMSTGGKAPP